jgi:hypothetical protein
MAQRGEAMSGTPFMQAIGPSYFLDDRKAAIQRAINCFPKKLDGANWMMASSPGETQIADLGAVGRASYNANGRWFVVAGATLYEYVSGTFTSRGTLSSSTGFVGAAHNRTQLALVDGTNLYIFNLQTNTLSTVVSAGWLGSDNVREMDGYFIFVDPGTDQFYLSAIDDGTTLDALDFSSADSSPDDIIAHIVSHRQLWLFGDVSTEIWINSGASDFPFVRYQSYTLDIGIVGPLAVISAADTLFWIGKTERGTGIVYQATGNQPSRVSTVAVEQALLSSTDLSAATMWTYQIDGHEFIGINAPGLESTWVYDAAQQQWHERAEWDAEWVQLRSKMVTAYQGEHYTLDSAGIVTRLDKEVNTLNGRTLKRERTWPHMIQPSMEPVSYKGVELAMATGSGGQVALEISNDGGYTYGPSLLRSLGVTGRWMQRVRWLGLGTSRNRVFKIWTTDNVPFAMHQANVDV